MWEKTFKAYIEYRKANNKDPPHKLRLGCWCGTQRHNYCEGILEKNRVDPLREAGFDFTIGEDQMQKAKQRKLKLEEWKNMYHMLVSFYEGKNFICNQISPFSLYLTHAS